MVGRDCPLNWIQRCLGLVRHTCVSVRVFPERIGVGGTDWRGHVPLDRNNIIHQADFLPGRREIRE